MKDKDLHDLLLRHQGPIGQVEVCKEAAERIAQLSPEMNRKQQTACEHCDGSGEVHNQIGEWLGTCQPCTDANLLAALHETASVTEPISTDLYGDRYFQGSFSVAQLTQAQDEFISLLSPSNVLRLVGLAKNATQPDSNAIRDAALEEAAKVCEKWGTNIVEKWAGDPDMSSYSKSRAWDGLQCAIAIRALQSQPAAEPKRDGLTAAVRDVLAERRRQQNVEGWTPEHDDKNIDCQLAAAAATYALCTEPAQLKVCGVTAWPWLYSWWKPTTYRRNLIKAGALILAEIERIDRSYAQPSSPTSSDAPLQFSSYEAFTEATKQVKAQAASLAASFEAEKKGGQQ